MEGECQVRNEGWFFFDKLSGAECPCGFPAQAEQGRSHQPVRITQGVNVRVDERRIGSRREEQSSCLNVPPVFRCFFLSCSACRGAGWWAAAGSNLVRWSTVMSLCVTRRIATNRKILLQRQV